MDAKERENLINFCVSATAELNGVDKEVVDSMEFESMNDEELTKEADWLSDLLDK